MKDIAKKAIFSALIILAVLLAVWALLPVHTSRGIRPMTPVVIHRTIVQKPVIQRTVIRRTVVQRIAVPLPVKNLAALGILKRHIRANTRDIETLIQTARTQQREITALQRRIRQAVVY